MPTVVIRVLSKVKVSGHVGLALFPMPVHVCDPSVRRAFMADLKSTLSQQLDRLRFVKTCLGK